MTEIETKKYNHMGILKLKDAVNIKSKERKTEKYKLSGRAQ